MESHRMILSFLVLQDFNEGGLRFHFGHSSHVCIAIGGIPCGMLWLWFRGSTVP